MLGFQQGPFPECFRVHAPSKWSGIKSPWSTKIFSNRVPISSGPGLWALMMKLDSSSLVKRCLSQNRFQKDFVRLFGYRHYLIASYSKKDVFAILCSLFLIVIVYFFAKYRLVEFVANKSVYQCCQLYVFHLKSHNWKWREQLLIIPIIRLIYFWEVM